MRGLIKSVRFNGSIATLTLTIPIEEYVESKIRPDNEAIIYRAKPMEESNIRKLGRMLCTSKPNPVLMHRAESNVMTAQDLRILDKPIIEQNPDEFDLNDARLK